MMCCVSTLSAGQKKISWLTSLLFGRIFGRGAKAVQAIIRLCEACLDGRVPIDEAGMYLMEHIDKKHIYALYDKALDTAETALIRNNIRLIRMAVWYRFE